MAEAAEQLEQEVLALSENERSRIALRLLRSLDGSSENATSGADEVANAWLAEAERRAEQIDRGEVELVLGDQVMDRLRKRFG